MKSALPIIRSSNTRNMRPRSPGSSSMSRFLKTSISFMCIMQFLMIHASNFRPVKRVGDVLKVFDMVAQKIPAKLLLIGGGSERNKCEKECRELASGEHIRFLGKMEMVDEILSVGDIFILPSETE